MNMLKKIGACLAGFALALTPVAAEAHGFNIYHGNDYVHVGSEHQNGWIHDKECDGNWAKAEVRYGSFSSSYADANGCGTDGGTQFAIGRDADQIRICEEVSTGNWDCNAWRAID
jgi:hypothetical protein